MKPLHKMMIVAVITALTMVVVCGLVDPVLKESEAALEEDAKVRVFLADRFGPASEVWVRHFCGRRSWNANGVDPYVCAIKDFSFTMECDFAEWRAERKKAK